MKKRIILIIMFLIFCVPFYVKAASVSVSVNCPGSAKAYSIVSCTIIARPSGADLKGIQANIKVTNGSYSEFVLASGWTVYSSSSAGFSLGRSHAVASSVTVGTLKLKMPASGNLKINLTNVVGSDSNYGTLNGNSPSDVVNVQSSVNTLKSLSLSNGSLSPNFSSNVTSYNANIDADSVNISGLATDSKAKVSGIGNKKLSYGNNRFSIVVTSESGDKKTYTININRLDNRSKNNNLSSLIVNNGKFFPNFSSNVTSYNLSVENDVTSIKISANVSDNKSTFLSGFGPRTVNLNFGNNKVLLKVKAENGSVKVYTINVNRKDNRSSDTSLSSLNISPASINFDSNITNYNIFVAHSIETINLEYTLNDPKAKAEVIGSKNLVVGNNKIIIKVTAENGKTVDYVINITREEEKKVLDNDTSLKEIIVNGNKIKLDSSKTYVYEVEQLSKVNVVALANKETSKVNVSVPEKLVNGSIISIVVTAESGSTDAYLVSYVVKEKNNNCIFIYVLIALVTFFITQVFNILLYKLVLSKKIYNY